MLILVTRIPSYASTNTCWHYSTPLTVSARPTTPLTMPSRKPMGEDGRMQLKRVTITNGERLVPYLVNNAGATGYVTLVCDGQTIDSATLNVTVDTGNAYLYSLIPPTPWVTTNIPAGSKCGYAVLDVTLPAMKHTAVEGAFKNQCEKLYNANVPVSSMNWEVNDTGIGVTNAGYLTVTVTAEPTIKINVTPETLKIEQPIGTTHQHTLTIYGSTTWFVPVTLRAEAISTNENATILIDNKSTFTTELAPTGTSLPNLNYEMHLTVRGLTATTGIIGRIELTMETP